ncbi:MAG: IclR family transcriptional regulator [Gemmobacter sp.]|nr:IclR family transcriptional regulator [Gemmobacter sp.]
MTILANASEILRCFSSDCTELTVTDVVTRLGMPKSNASRLMKAMREAGLLETIGDSKRHRPGRLFLNITAAFRSSSLLIQMAADAVARVSQTCGHTGYVSVRDGRDMMAVTDHPGSNALRVVSTLGRRLSAHASATGRTLLARETDATVCALYDHGLMTGPSASPQTLEALLQRLAQIRARGYDISSDAAAPGIDALAVAVADPAQGEMVSLCIVFPGAVVGSAERSAILASLCAEAAEIATITGDAAFRAEPLSLTGTDA